MSRSQLATSCSPAPSPNGRLALGTWQGLYLYEHRHAGHARSVVVTVMGER